ncbi:MAG TPA: substrate-binding domain-containing protein [Acidimicrobiales bacterium]|nr:substrate-binding domain-containing protein [Acidimicrobiales bacterium]
MKARASLIGVVVLGAATATAIAPANASVVHAATSNITVAYVTGDQGDPYFITERCGAMAQAKSMGATLKWFGTASTAVANEFSLFNSAAVTNPSALVLAPFSNTGFSASVDSLMKKGIPVSLTGGNLTPAAGYQVVESNYTAGGELLASVIGKITGGTGTIAIIAQSTGNPPDAERYVGLEGMLKKDYPNLKVLAPQYGQASSATSASIASSLIVANPGLKLIYATNGPQAIGAASAIAAAGDTSKIKLVSFDSTPDQVNLIKEGKLVATVAQSPYYTAALGVKAVVSYLKSHPAVAPVKPSGAAVIHTPLQLLTPANINTPLAKKFEYVTSCSVFS